MRVLLLYLHIVQLLYLKRVLLLYLQIADLEDGCIAVHVDDDNLG